MGSERAETDPATSAGIASADADLAAKPAGSPTASAAAAAEALSPERSREALDLEFNLAVDVIYHRARRAWFARWHRWAMFGAVMAGSVAATDMAGAKVCALIAAACAAADLVFDPITRAYEHGEAARNLVATAFDIQRDDFSAEACRRARERVFEVSAGEPAAYHAARDLAFNQAVIALGRDKAALLKISRGKRWMANWRRYEGH